MKKFISLLSILVIFCLLGVTRVIGRAEAQEHTENNKDQTLRGSGRVNASTLGMEFGLPLGSYAGRGISIPVSLNYSSKVWRMDNTGSYPIPATGGGNRCVSGNEAKFAEHSAGGWTSSMQEVYVEYTGYDERYNGEGFPLNAGIECIPAASANNNHGSYVRRIQLHLPDGSSHELRMDEQPLKYDRSGSCGDSYAPCSNNPELAANWNGWYYAVDGSNLRYYEDRTNHVYVLQLPDGSHYDFKQNLEASSDYKTIRKASVITDRHGNSVTYHQPNSSVQPDFPNGYWTDTLGRVIGVPLPVNEPSSPTVQEYKMPGISGQSAPVYKFHWKKLKGANASSSALSDFNQSLKYLTDWGSYPGTPNMSPQRAASTVLFHSGWDDWAVSENELFNPVLLAAIELPDGQRYEFGYNEFGELVTVKYPTGGKETFTMDKVASLGGRADDGVSNKESNRGVTSRKLYESANAGGFYEWTYLAEHINTYAEFRTVITNPDLTRTERYLHQGVQIRDQYNGSWGYSDALSGMAYKEESYNANNQLMAKKLTTWAKKSISVANVAYRTADLHTRVTQEENIVYDPVTAGALSSTTKYEYAGDLDQRDTPLLQNIVRQYPFVVNGAALPANPEKTAETIFLQYDSTVDQTIRTSYRNLNMVGLVTETRIRDASNTVKARSQIIYDEPTYLETAIPSGVPGWTNPSTSSFRGLATTTKSWSDVVNNQFIETHALYDKLGNVKKSWDGRGNYSEMSYADNYADDTNRNSYALPTETKSYSGANGTGTQMTTSIKYDFNTGLPRFSTDANGQATEIQYIDALLRPTKAIAPNGHQTITQYGAPDASGTFPAAQRFVKTKTQIDANNWKEGVAWFDGLGRTYKSQSVDSNGDVFALTCYDAVGRVLKTSNPFRNVSNPGCSSTNLEWTTNTFDAAGRPWKVTTPDNAVVETNYGLATSGNNLGTVVTVTDQAGKQRRSITNAFGQLERVDEPNTLGNLGTISAPVQPTVYKYDTIGKMSEVTQGVQQRFFLYDSLGRLLRVRQPEQQVNSALNLSNSETTNTQWTVGFSYDANGNVLTTTDAKNVTTTSTYDALNRVLTRNYSDANTPAVSYTYDDAAVPFSKGKLTKVGSTISETKYTVYDMMGRLTTSEQRTPFGTESVSHATPRTSEYKYNLAGIMIEQTYPSGRVMKNILETDGDLAAISSRVSNGDFKTYASNFAYTASGVIKHLQIGNGLWESAVMNSRDQVTELNLGNSPTDGSLWKLNYDYGEFDTNGNVDATKNAGNIVKQTIGFNGSTKFVQTYKYDSLDRIKEAKEMSGGNQTWIQTYDYDRYGNRTQFSQNILGQQMSTNNQTLPAVDTTTNKFQTGQGYDYDANGNLVQDHAGRQFTFDGDNKQTLVKDSANNPIGQYFYDGNGKRVKKVTNSETVIFVYDGTGKLVAEYSTATPVQNPTTNYTATDPLGSPRVITNKQGQIVSRKDFMPFGEELTSDATYRTANLKYGMADNVRQKFTGYQRDEETQLDFAEARYYNNSHGRFTAVDPLLVSGKSADPQTFNRYAYTMNRPLILIDSTGLQAGSPVKPDDENIKTTVESVSSRRSTLTTGEAANVYISESAQYELNEFSVNLERLLVAQKSNYNAALEYGVASINQADASSVALESVCFIANPAIGLSLILPNPYQNDTEQSAAYFYTDSKGMLNMPGTTNTAQIGGEISGVGGGVGSEQNFPLGDSASLFQSAANSQQREIDGLTTPGERQRFIDRNLSGGATARTVDANGNEVGSTITINNPEVSLGNAWDDAVARAKKAAATNRYER